MDSSNVRLEESSPLGRLGLVLNDGFGRNEVGALLFLVYATKGVWRICFLSGALVRCLLKAQL
jgi:hypothetical protein